MDNNPASEPAKHNAVVYPVGRDHEGKQIWSVSKIGGTVLNRALMVEISQQTVIATEGSVVWETEPSLIANDRVNPDWLAWFVSTHGVDIHVANEEVNRRLSLFYTCRPPKTKGNEPVGCRTTVTEDKTYKALKGDQDG